MTDSSRTGPPLILHLFGSFEARLHGLSLPRLRTRKEQSLLAFLALRAGGEVERDWLAGLLWPESAEAPARRNLRTSLAEVRRALGTEAGRLCAAGPRSLALDLTGAEVDVVTFDAAIARGDVSSLGQAVSLYRGPLLEGCSQEWVFQERQVREEAYLRALEILAADAQAGGNLAAAVVHLRRVVTVDPLREGAQRALMQALAAHGNYAAAIQVYRELRLRLYREINAEPDAETQALFQQLRAAAREKASARGTNARCPGTSEGDGSDANQIKGETVGVPVTLPERASADSQAAGGHPDLPGKRLASGSGHNLPHELARFIGREDQMAELQQWLSTSRLVTLTGAGGYGKSRLAREVGRRVLAPPAAAPDAVPGAIVAEEYRDGIWLVELAPLADPVLVPQSVAAALGVREVPGQPLTQTLLAYLQPRRLLLLLDNCEHLIGACARLAEALLQSCPTLRILATSREPLGVMGERAYRVPSLSLPPVVDGSWLIVDGPAKTDPSSPPTINHPLSTINQYAAIRLFCDRAAAVVPAFMLTLANAAAVAQVCRRLDGIPLAIELAAARLKALPVETLAARLDDMFGLLTGGSRTALPRHQTLRALIDWSYDLLSEPERALLRRLSVFAGGCTLEAAEAVCSDQVDSRWLIVDRPDRPEPSTINYQLSTHEVLDLLTSLVDKSLVQYEARADGARYRLLETVRQYSRERLEVGGTEGRVPDGGGGWGPCPGGEAAAVRERHCDWCLALAEEVPGGYWRGSETAWLDRLEREHDNLRAALAWCVKAVDSGQWLVVSPAECGSRASPSSPELTTNHHPLTTALRLAGALSQFWFARGCYGEGRKHLAGLLALPGAEARTAARAKALYGAGTLAQCQGDCEAARALYQESLALFREVGDEFGIPRSLNGLGFTMREEGEYEAARALHEESLAIFRKRGEKQGIAWSLDYLGLTVRNQGDSGAARALFEESLAIFRELGEKPGIGYALQNLGQVAHVQGDYRAARALVEESLVVFRELGEKLGIAYALSDVGWATYDEGDCQAAWALFEEGLAIFQGLGHKRGIPRFLEGLAAVAVAEARFQRAARLFGAAEALREAIGAPLPPAERADYERNITTLRAALGQAGESEAGGPGPGFAAAWAEGRALSLEQAMGYALHSTSAPRTAE